MGGAPATTVPELAGIDTTTARSIVQRALCEGREQLTQVEALALVAAYGVATARGEIATSEDDAARCAAALGYPVAVKVVSPDIVHKTEVGVVRVGVTTEAELREACRDMLAALLRPHRGRASTACWSRRWSSAAPRRSPESRVIPRSVRS